MPRKPGISNDERVTNTAMVDRHGADALETMAVPALVIYAEDDPLASFGDVERLVEDTERGVPSVRDRRAPRVRPRNRDQPGSQRVRDATRRWL